MTLLGEEPAALAPQDQFFGIRLGSWTVVAVPEGLVGDGASRCVMATLSFLDVPEQFFALVGVNAALEDSRDALPVQLLVDDGEGLGAALNLDRKSVV